MKNKSFDWSCTIIAMLGMAGLAISKMGSCADLLSLYYQAKANNPSYLSAQYTFEAAKQKIPQARAGLLPSLYLNGNAGKTSEESSFSPYPSLDRDVNAWSWSIQLSQPLIRMQNIYAYQESLLVVVQAQAQLRQSEQELILNVARAYFDVVTMKEEIAAAQAQVDAMEEQLELATHGHQAGKLALTDIYEAKSRKDLAQSQWIAARNALANKQTDLEKLVGQVSYPLSELKPGAIVPKILPADRQAWADQAKENNPIVLKLVAASSAAQAEVKRIRAEHLPTVDMSAAYGRNYMSGNLTMPNDYSTLAKTRQIGIQVNVPIFVGGAISARAKEAVLNELKAQQDLDGARRQASAEVNYAYLGIENGAAAILALESAVESSRRMVQGSQVGFKLGIRTNLDVLNAQQQIYEAIRDLAKTRYEVLYQGLKLKAAAGVLKESDLVEISSQMMNHRDDHEVVDAASPANRADGLISH